VLELVALELGDHTTICITISLSALVASVIALYRTRHMIRKGPRNSRWWASANAEALIPSDHSLTLDASRASTRSAPAKRRAC